WSSPTSQRVATMLRSTPLGRGGAGGTTPFSMSSVQVASECSVGSLPIWPSREDVFGVAGQRVSELVAEVAAGFQRVEPVVLRYHAAAGVAFLAVAGELILRRRFHKREPVVAGI